MLEARQAIVQPRVLSPLSGDALPLVEVLERHRDRCGLVVVHGLAGSGKTTALCHLLATLPGRLRVFDRGADEEKILREARRGLVVSVDRRPDVVEEFELAPWGLDEAMEYLLVAHPGRCKDVMGRLARSRDGGFSTTSPQLWRATLDEMASTDEIGPLDALARAVGPAPGRLWTRHDLVRALVEGGRIARSVLAEGPPRWPRGPDPQALAEAARRLVARRDEAHRALLALWEKGHRRRQAIAASLLVALAPQWRPTSDGCLAGAQLAGASWPGVSLPGVRLDRATLDGANLEAASLEKASLQGIQGRRLALDHANLLRANLHRARLTAARLRGVQADHTTFVGAVLSGADLTGASLRHAWLTRADLRQALLVEADLRNADLREVQLAGADFSRADLDGANLDGLNLSGGRWSGTKFWRASLHRALLQGLRVSSGFFEGARLHAADLSGSVMPGARFGGASLREALLGQISWRGADLREADLHHAVFHGGTSRCGLVDSLLASEGTRTGFYTDEFEEQGFKAPEEIRKADLRDADLRGATVTETDFYLVDLRGARYDADQAEHFRRCRAILETRSA